MRSDAELEAWLQAALTEYRVAGAAVAVVTPENVFTASGGIADARSGRRVSSDTVFRLGSVTKVLTATLVMRLIEEGRLGLDDPLSDVVAEFRGADPPWNAVTVRHALSKSDGLQDMVSEFGAGDGAVAAYVAALATAGFVHAPGEMFSYGNAGSIVLGRLLELHHNEPFDELLRHQLENLFGMATTFPLPNDADIAEPFTGSVGSHEVAVSYRLGASGLEVGTEPWPPGVEEPRALSPCGATLGTTIQDFAALIQGHISDTVLRTSTLHEMRELHATTPEAGRAAGLGWLLTPSDPAVAWHGGGSRPMGSYAFGAVHRGGVGLAVLANNPSAQPMAQALVAKVRAELLGDEASKPPAETTPAASDDIERCTGTYRRAYATFQFASAEDRLCLTVSPGPFGDVDSARWAGGDYYPLNRKTFLGPRSVVTFLGDGTNPAFMFDGRAATRVQE